MKPIDFAAHKKAADRSAYKSRGMDAWDRLFPEESKAQRIGKQSRLDVDPEVRRKAKHQL